MLPRPIAVMLLVVSLLVATGSGMSVLDPAGTQLANDSDPFGQPPPPWQPRLVFAVGLVGALVAVRFLMRPMSKSNTSSSQLSRAESINPRLAEWDGCSAQVWDYGISHSTMRIKLQRRGTDPCCVLYLGDCSSVVFVPSWEASAIRIESLGSRFCVTNGGSLRIECGNVFLSHVFPSYAAIPPNSLDYPSLSG